MPAIVFVRGGPYFDASGAPLPWEISKQPGLDEEGPYVFYPGVPVEVSARDAAWLMDPNNTRERVFQIVGKGRGDSESKTSTDAPPPPPPPVDPPADPTAGSKETPAANTAPPAPDKAHASGRPS